MGLINMLKGVINKMLGRQEVTNPFKVDNAVSAEVMNRLQIWDDLYQNSVTNLPSIIVNEASRLATIDMKVTVDGGVRAEAIQKVFTVNRDKFRNKLALGVGYGGLILKPCIMKDKIGIDFVPAIRYIPVEFDTNGDLTKVIFVDRVRQGDIWLSRLEYHHFEGDLYIVENKAFKSNTKLSLGYEVSLKVYDKWAELAPVVTISGLDQALFGYFRMPSNIKEDVDSPLGASIFAEAVETIKDFDMIYLKWRRECKLSDKYLFIDEAAMMKPNANGGRAESVNPVPELIKGLKFNGGASKCIEEFSPEIRVDAYALALKTQLNIISVQCGFSSGYLNFDERSGNITATQIESEDQRTLSTCTDIQLNFETAIKGLITAMEKLIDLYELYPSEELDINIYLKDLFINTSEDRDRAYKLATNGFIPKWRYLMDYEGYSEEEAKALVEEVNSSISQPQG